MQMIPIINIKYLHLQHRITAYLDVRAVINNQEMDNSFHGIELSATLVSCDYRHKILSFSQKYK